MVSAGIAFQIGMNGSYFPDTFDQLQIGASRNLNGNRYEGSIDEVAIYTNVLSSARIQAHFAAASGLGYTNSVLRTNR